MPEYRYRIQSTGASSHKYGPCEVCGKHVSEVFSQIEQRWYGTQGDPATDNEVMLDLLDDPGMYIWGHEVGWTEHGCHSLFGHEACLLKARR